MIRAACLSFCAAACGCACAAQGWDGTYRLGPGGDCARVGEEGGALLISDGLFLGVDARCRMTDPVDVVDMDAVLYVMACEGGGEAWSERAMVMRAAPVEAGGEAIFLLWDGYAFRYERCPEPGDEPGDEPAPAPEPEPAEEASPPRAVRPDAAPRPATPAAAG